MGEVAGEIQRELGELCGRMKAIESSLKEINTAIKLIAENKARLEKAEEQITQHDKRICAIERKCEAREKEHEHFRDHVKGDVPVRVAAGDAAIKIIIFVGGLVGAWLAQNMGRIIDLFR